MQVLNFIINNILTQASIIIALIALLGLVLQKKPVGAVISGTMKTMLGFLVLSAGSAVIVSSLTYFGDIFKAAFGLKGLVASIEGINGQAMNELGLGSEIAITLAGIFIVNIIIARFTKFKYIFLTGQALLWEATLCVVFAYYCGLTGVPLIIIGSIVGGFFATFMPAFAQPIVKKITGSEDIALGHLCTIGYMFTALIAKLTGGKSKSTEEINLPKSLEFLQDTYLSVMVVMVPLYVITAAFAGPAACAEYAGNTNFIVHAFLQGMQFVVGVYVLMTGVRMLLAEIVPAFQGISMKLVPNSVPALDCPVLFPYAPNAVIFGFVFNHRFYHRNVPDSGIRTSYGTAGCTFQLLRRRNCRYICKPGRRKTGSHDRMYRPRNLYYLPAGDALTDACRHRIHQYDLYGCGYGSDRLPVHAV